MNTDIREIIQYLILPHCFTCGDPNRQTTTSVLENSQDNTQIGRIEYLCLRCGTKEKREIEFADIRKKWR